jgi:patatin-like phospholipase/acyl hydrolase
MLIEDGGGIRGYSSLLILEALMETIEREEAQPGFANIPNARGVSTQSAKKTLPLPCHYFDYIFGTSTGGYCKHLCGDNIITDKSVLYVAYQQ